MTVLIGDIKDVGLVATQGTITVRSAFTRRARESTGIITRETRVYELVDGRFRTRELDPGRVCIELAAPGVFEAWEFDLPASGTVSLADVLQHEEEYAPEVVTAARAAAAQAEAAAARASGFESGASRARDEAVAAQASIGRVMESATAIVRDEFTDLTGRAESAAASSEASRSASASSASASAASATSAKKDADRAESAAGKAAKQSADQARAELAGFAQSAAQSEQNAAGSAVAAKQSADRAGVSEQAAAGSAERAESDRVRAETAAKSSEASQSAAAGSASAAKTDAAAVGSARRAAESARDEAVQAAESAKVGAPESGWPRESLAEPVRDSLDKAEKALTTVPRANRMSPGGVRLAGDLGGTWDSPTVPGLKDKLDKQPVSVSATSGSLVQRTSGGQVKTSTPAQSDDAATKLYVDQSVDRRVSLNALDYDAGAYSVARRDGNGALTVGEPTAPQHAATKAWVEKQTTPLVTQQQLDDAVAQQQAGSTETSQRLDELAEKQQAAETSTAQRLDTLSTQQKAGDDALTRRLDALTAEKRFDLTSAVNKGSLYRVDSCILTKRAGVVTMQVSNIKSITNFPITMVQAAAIPPEFRPAESAYGVLGGSDNAVLRLNVRADGGISTANYSAGTTYLGQVVWHAKQI